MLSARCLARATSFGQAVLVLLAVCLATGAGAQTISKSTAARKTTVAASKRSASKNSKVSMAASSTHGRTAATSHDEADGGSARVRTRKVVVTRKLVHGKWVRTTRIVHADPGPTFQTHPDQERYQQIQQAMAQKGYFKGEANGVWGDDSVAALKQFQTDRKLNNDGKLSSVSLIGLGLGPNRETATVKAEAAPPASPADPEHN